MRLDLLAEGCRFGWRELCIVFGRSDFFAQIEIEVPGAYDTVSASRVSGRDLAITIPPVSLPLYISLPLSFSLTHTHARDWDGVVADVQKRLAAVYGQPVDSQSMSSSCIGERKDW